MQNMQLDSKVNELRIIEAEMKALAARSEAIKDELKRELDERKADSIDTGLHRIFYTAYEKANVDTAKLKEEGLYNKFLKKSTVLTFKIADVKLS